MIFLKASGVQFASPRLWINKYFMERITESTWHMLANTFDMIQYLYSKGKRAKWGVVLNKIWKYKMKKTGVRKKEREQRETNGWSIAFHAKKAYI